jgi:hypothetical protein
MHPVDRADEDRRRHSRKVRKLAHLAKTVMMNAATGELQRIEALMHLTRVGDIPPEEAQEMLARIRETQLRRRGAA